MTWKGKWRNQYGSIVEIKSDVDGRIEGVFRTALKDSSFHGQTVSIWGAAWGDVIGFSSRQRGRQVLRR